MSLQDQLRVLFFDTFGTSVAQTPVVAVKLSRAAREALEVASIRSEVREKASNMTYEKWSEFGAEWNSENEAFVKRSIKEHGTVDWKAVDKNRIDLLPKLLADRGLVVLRERTSNGEAKVEEGSLWNESQLQHLGRIWHRLTPWPDTSLGLDLLNTNFSTVTLSNTYNDLLQGLIAQSNIPFTHVYSADLFESYKPNPKVYLGAAEKMGVKPEECALVAAHLGDLKGAKACGFFTIYVERPLEEKNPELKDEFSPDIWIEQSKDGFVTLAKELGI